MTLPTHVLAGLIIGKITGNFPAALAGAVLIDCDHLISYFRHGIAFKPKKLYKAIISAHDAWGDQRNILHGIFGWIIVSSIITLIHPPFGIVFALAYLLHLVLDAIDTSVYYPFFPIRKFPIKGIVKHNSTQELKLNIYLIALYLLF